MMIQLKHDFLLFHYNKVDYRVISMDTHACPHTDTHTDTLTDYGWSREIQRWLLWTI